MKDGLCQGSIFEIDNGVNRPRNLEDFLRRLQKYIDYEENDLAGKSVAKPSTERDLDQKEHLQGKDTRGSQCNREPRLT